MSVLCVGCRGWWESLGAIRNHVSLVIASSSSLFGFSCTRVTSLQVHQLTWNKHCPSNLVGLHFSQTKGFLKKTLASYLIIIFFTPIIKRNIQNIFGEIPFSFNVLLGIIKTTIQVILFFLLKHVNITSFWDNHLPETSAPNLFEQKLVYNPLRISFNNLVERKRTPIITCVYVY